MTPTIPTSEPTTLTRGDSTKWTKAFSEYLPADGWTLTYYFTSSDGSGEGVFNVVGTNNGDGSFLVTLAVADSRKFIVGNWTWQAVVTKAAELITLATGTIQIVQGLSSLDASIGVDMRSDNRKMLDDVIVALRSGISRGSSMSYNGRSVTWNSLSELQQLRKQLESDVRIEELGENAGLGRQIRVRYGAA